MRSAFGRMGWSVPRAPRHAARWVGAGAAAVLATWAPAAQPDEALVDRARAVLVEAVAPEPVPGMTGAIVLHDGSVIEFAAGEARVAPNEEPMTTDSKMLSGSIGKVYCAAVVLQMVGEGSLSLDARAGEYLDDAPWFGALPNAQTLTVRSLLNHTSGIPEHVWLPSFGEALRADPQRDWSFGELLSLSGGVEPLFAVGEGWSYADTNYLVLGAIVEAVTGRRYEAVLREGVFGPLGLEDTLTNEQPELPGLVSGYTALGRVFPISEETAAGGVYGMNPVFERTGGGITSTAADLARFGHAVYAGDLIPEALREPMREGVAADPLGPGVRYGLGTIVWPTEHGEAYGHEGIMPGYLSVVRHYPEVAGGVTIAVQVNTDRPIGNRAMHEAVEGLAGLMAGE